MNIAIKSRLITVGLKQIKLQLNQTTDQFADNIRLDNLSKAYINLKYVHREMHGGNFGDQFEHIIRQLHNKKEWTFDEDYLRDKLYAHREQLYEQMELLGLTYYNDTRDKGDSENPPRKK